MKPYQSFLLRLLKNSLPATIFAACLGYALAYGAAVFIEVSTPPRMGIEVREDAPANAVQRAAPAGTMDVGATLKARLPISLACWTFGLILLFEILVAVRRSLSLAGIHEANTNNTISQATAENKQDVFAGSGMNPEVERLLNQILEKSEQNKLSSTPIPKPSDTIQSQH